jgi:hypothetical protein
MPTLATLCAFLACGPAYGATWEAERPGRLGQVSITAEVVQVAGLNASEQAGLIEAETYGALGEHKATWLVLRGVATHIDATGGLDVTGPPGFVAMRLETQGPLYAVKE